MGFLLIWMRTDRQKSGNLFFAVLCFSWPKYPATATAVAAPQNLGVPRSELLYMLQQFGQFSRSHCHQRKQCSPVFIASLNRSSDGWHVGKNRMSKFELEKKLWNFEIGEKWRFEGYLPVTVTVTVTVPSPDLTFTPKTRPVFIRSTPNLFSAFITRYMRENFLIF